MSHIQYDEQHDEDGDGGNGSDSDALFDHRYRSSSETPSHATTASVSITNSSSSNNDGQMTRVTVHDNISLHPQSSNNSNNSINAAAISPRGAHSATFSTAVPSPSLSSQPPSQLSAVAVTAAPLSPRVTKTIVVSPAAKHHYQPHQPHQPQDHYQQLQRPPSQIHHCGPLNLLHD